MHCITAMRARYAGEVPQIEDDEWRIGYGTVAEKRRATAEDLDAMDLDLLVSCAQDIFHAVQRIMRQVRMFARDRAALHADVKRILAPCSCNNGYAAIQASNPVDLRQQVVQLAEQVSTGLLELQTKYDKSVSKGSTMRATINTMAARLALEGGDA
jgi:hypothetical protein